MTFVFGLDPVQLSLKTPANPGFEGRDVIGRPFPLRRSPADRAPRLNDRHDLGGPGAGGYEMPISSSGLSIEASFKDPVKRRVTLADVARAAGLSRPPRP